MSRRIKGLAIDLEGTAVSVEEVHHQAQILAAADVGVTLTMEEASTKLPHLIGGPDEEVAREILDWKQATGLQPGSNDNVKYVVERKIWHYQKLLKTASIAPRSGFEDFLCKVKAGPFAVCIGSGTLYQYANSLLLASGLYNLFESDEIILGDGFAQKPDPAIFLETARRMRIDPAEQLVFEDSARGVRAGRTAGSLVIGMPYYKRPEAVIPLIEAGASRIFHEWDEINIDALFENLANE